MPWTKGEITLGSLRLRLKVTGGMHYLKACCVPSVSSQSVRIHVPCLQVALVILMLKGKFVSFDCADE